MQLPAEIHLNIIERLSPLDKACLRSANKTFHNIIFTQFVKYTELYKAEGYGWVQGKGLLACVDCKRLRHVTKFADDMRAEILRHTTRVCLPCGLKNIIFSRGRCDYGNRVKMDGIVYVIRYCHQCNGRGLTPRVDDFSEECLFCKARKAEELGAHIHTQVETK